jgi:hypothetical protein
MAFPPDETTKTDGDAIMLEVERPVTSITAGAKTVIQSSSSQIIPSTIGDHGSIHIKMTSTYPNYDETYSTTRPSRESVLRRLSEALLRRSLAKVCRF